MLYGSGFATGPRCYFTEADRVDAGPGWKVAKYGLSQANKRRERKGEIPKRLCVPCCGR